MLKTPLNVPQQLAQFQSHGILVQDEAAALSILERVSYYRLSGYALEFRTSAHSDHYAPGTTIEQIYDRYRFDEDLRHILRKYVEIAEIFYRTQIANTISLRKCSQPPHDQHYDAANYYRKEHFQDLMVQLRKQLHYYKDSLFIQHHMGKYHGRMPLWVLVEVMSLSMLSKYYSCLYRSDQEAIAIPLHTSARTLHNHLHALSVLRNKCAHAARLYNTVFSPKVILPVRVLRRASSLQTDTLFAYIIMLAYRLPDESIKESYKKDILILLHEYQGKLPLARIGLPSTDRETLETILQNA